MSSVTHLLSSLSKVCIFCFSITLSSLTALSSTTQGRHSGRGEKALVIQSVKHRQTFHGEQVRGWRQAGRANTPPPPPPRKNKNKNKNTLHWKLIKEKYFSVQCSDYCRTIASVRHGEQMPPPPPKFSVCSYGPG